MLDRKVAVAVCATTVGLAMGTTGAFADGKTGTVTVSTLNIRSGPSTSYSIVTKVHQGDKLEILESSNGWHKVKLSNGKIGWGSGNYISVSGSSSNNSSNQVTGKMGTITTAALNIRSGASTSHSIVTKAYQGDKVKILDSSNGWHKVQLSNGKSGWGHGGYISLSDSNAGSGNNANNGGETSTPVTGKTGTITTAALNIRSGPSTSYGIITKVYEGNKVEILEKSSNGWYKVKLSNGKIGWGSGSYISLSDSSAGSGNNANNGGEISTPVTGKKGTITTAALNIRSGPSTSYGVITKAYQGDRVDILESSNGWYKVKLSNGKVGWGSSSYISLSNSNTGSGSNSSSDNGQTSQSKVQKVLSTAMAQLGKPYVWGAEGPNSFDCSGLTYYVYKQVGITLPRVSTAQYSVGRSVSWNNLQPGDLMFSSTDGSGRITHVGIYIGNGQMIHAPKPGDVVQKTSINNSYWKNAHVGAKRVL
ncbi:MULTISPECIES: SH3 domain-containing protein [Romboutsia]|uniref:NlpC/P60 protein n=1 Tax=Romboutsia hominis TaxID=1507512 RepID=A0A2P2BW06_9FIRM|nr:MULTISPECIES: SH3 domain-containing protein [Romboutsia]MDB8793585.1 SH3 domain-containing protein [Romboutsia sp. 1001216sp1]MDB8794982.1 SH3 domain-containing protein [Romboutsia sp. 1001216sp1]MDB8798793.1 SH3 domain-containing protein [Romboutsia sp. 1001216sp1]MDB8804226.1 SH3 domain-containing protein [Romboutsia sp. 1001216sp1]MDB8808818.1 SH3 domain-containing protein [Romboutsia sp. 1001216sp1]